MEFTDIFLAPPYILFIYIVAIIIRSRNYAHLPARSLPSPKRSVQAGYTQAGSPLWKYFIPGLTVKIIGAIAAGMIYQFYYPGGDTFGYYQGTQIIWNALKDDPGIALKILFSSANEYDPYINSYTSQILLYHDPRSFLIIKLSAIIGFFCFNSYTVIVIILASLSFTGMWKMYRTFVDIYPHLHKQLAIAILFIPSVFFWGSGLFKDTYTLAAFGWLIYGVYNLFIKRRKVISSIVIIAISSYLITSIKVYIIFGFMPALLFWIFLNYRDQIRSKFLRIAITPMVIIISLITSYSLLQQLGEEYEGYAVENFIGTAQAMQHWHQYVSEHYGVGSGYTLGEIDPSMSGILRTFPAAINVTLFRPYIWEVHNIVILLAALESTLIFLFTLSLIIKGRIIKVFKIIFTTPILVFCFIFVMIFGFAVGFSSYNFGALVRYKIPCIPFYVAMLFIIRDILRKERKNKFQIPSTK